MKMIDPNLTPLLSARGLLDFSIDELPFLMNDVAQEKDLGNKFMKLFIILQNFKMDAFALEMQDQAFLHRHVFRFLSPPQPQIRLLVIAGPGNMSHNVPLDFVVFNQNIQLDYFYVVDDNTSWESIPDHDIAILGLGQASHHNALHRCIEKQRKRWVRPFLNNAQGVMHCARDSLYDLLKDDPDVRVPRTQRVTREDLGEVSLPCLLRPIDSHGGEDFEKIADASALTHYLYKSACDVFYVSDYLDCSQPDGRFRKFRIAMIDTQPYVCHLAISDDWVVHYKSAHMELSLQKRQEEEKFMREFDAVFRVQYGAALSRIAHRLGLDYVVLDCAISREGQLVLFEADIGAWIHDTDDPDVYPYKSEIMNKAFTAFTKMLMDHSKLAAPAAQLQVGSI
jgi:hypothetical protein